MQENQYQDLSFCKYVVDKLMSNKDITPTFTSTHVDEQELLDNLKDMNECINILQTYRQRLIYKILDTQI